MRSFQFISFKGQNNSGEMSQPQSQVGGYTLISFCACLFFCLEIKTHSSGSKQLCSASTCSHAPYGLSRSSTRLDRTNHNALSLQSVGLSTVRSLYILFCVLKIDQYKLTFTVFLNSRISLICYDREIGGLHWL